MYLFVIKTFIIQTDLAEQDLPYTHGLMNKDKEDFAGKEILILGGGDGALLWELLKEKPKFVTMIDVRTSKFCLVWRRMRLRGWRNEFWEINSEGEEERVRGEIEEESLIDFSRGRLIREQRRKRGMGRAREIKGKELLR